MSMFMAFFSVFDRTNFLAFTGWYVNATLSWAKAKTGVSNRTDDKKTIHIQKALAERGEVSLPLASEI